MLKDKPLLEVMQAMLPVVHLWHLASLGTGRGASAQDLQAALNSAGVSAPVTQHSAVTQAYAAALADAGPGDRVVVFGSFYTVGAILRQLQQERVR
jgi:dihydrofolate synthase/folylpolyglutamate synthase